MEPTSAARSWRSAVLIAALAGYWLALFLSTHLPALPGPMKVSGLDKLAHCAAYAGLAFLFAAVWLGWKRHSWPVFAAIASGLAIYGILDEISQVPVGRTADVYDWFADLLGISLGLLLHAVLTYFGRGTAQAGAETAARDTSSIS